MDLQLETRTDNGYSLVRVGGEIDLATAPRLREELLAAVHGSPRLVVDTTRISFIDSSGLSALIDACRRAEGDGGWLHLVVQEGNVSKVLKLCGLDRRIPVYPTVDEAATLS